MVYVPTPLVTATARLCLLLLLVVVFVPLCPRYVLTVRGQLLIKLSWRVIDPN